MQITKEVVDKLQDENVTKKEYDSIIKAITQRVSEIWKFIIKASGRKLDWWAFSNDVDLGRGNGSTGGQFDPKNDAVFIDILGEYSEKRDWSNYLYDNGFPTRFLWENFQDEVVEHVEECKKISKKEKEKQKQKNEQHQEQIRSIKSKLTKEELKFVDFKR